MVYRLWNLQNETMKPVVFFGTPVVMGAHTGYEELSLGDLNVDLMNPEHKTSTHLVRN